MGTIAVAQGWYIRGDLGYSASINGGDPSYRYIDALDVGPEQQLRRHALLQAVLYGFGMGYQFNDYLRTDLTADFFNSSVDGELQIGSNCPVSAGSCDLTHDTGFDAISIPGERLCRPRHLCRLHALCRRRRRRDQYPVGRRDDA